MNIDTTNFVPQEIPLDQLHDSPSQPRTEYKNIDGLAANIIAVGGIHTPLKVCRRPAGGFWIIFGHRRKRGAAKAELPTAPCLIVDMTDAEVRALQMSENIQRDNMTALEEARGFKAQIDEDGLTPLEISKRIGKSRSWVYGRLRLLDLCAEVRTAVEAGDIDAESALLVARVGNEKMQRKALGYIKGKAYDLEDGGARTYRSVQALLNERFTLQLDAAIFDPADALLLADVGSCLTCPKLSGNAPEFADIAGQPTDEELDKQDEADDDSQSQWQRRRGLVRNRGKSVCTDPDCFDAKKKAHLKHEAAKLASAGAVVVDGNKARAAISADGKVKGAYIALADVKAELKKAPKAAGGGAVTLPAPVTIQNPVNGKTVQAYSLADLAAAGMKVKAEPSGQASREEQERKRQEERKAAEAKAQAEHERRYALLLRVREAGASRQRSAFELRMVASQALNAVGYHDVKTLLRLHDVKSKAELERRIDTLAPDALTALLLDCLIVDNVACESYNVHQKPAPLLALAEHYGIDPKAPTQAPVKAATPAAKKAAPPAQKPAARQVKYRNPDTGETWTGRGLQPAWLKAAIARGRQLADFLTSAEASPAAVATKKAKRGPVMTGDAGAPDDQGLFNEAEAAA